MTHALLTHHLDQQAADIRDFCAETGIDLTDESVRRAIKLVTDWCLVAGYMAEPNPEHVASAFFLMASAWHEVVA